MAKLRVFIPLLFTAALLIGAAASYGVVSSQPANGQFDTDGDGLIEVSNLEQLNAIRYDLDGNGSADESSGADTYAAAFPGTVCRDYCQGYELALLAGLRRPRKLCLWNRQRQVALRRWLVVHRQRKRRI